MAQQPHPTQTPQHQPPAGQQAQQQSEREQEQQGRQGERGERQQGKRPDPGQPGSQRVSPPRPDLTRMQPPPGRPGTLNLPGAQQSIFENQPGQQLVGEPAHEGYEEDRQHLRGRIIQQGQAEEDKEPKPKGVPKGPIGAGRMSTEQPDATEEEQRQARAMGGPGQAKGEESEEKESEQQGQQRQTSQQQPPQTEQPRGGQPAGRR